MMDTKDNQKQKEKNNLAAVEPADTGAPESGVSLGQYNISPDKLSQDQMLGIGGGTEFLEVTSYDGDYVKHIAMPVLLRDRAVVKDLLKAHAKTLMKIHKLSNKSQQLVEKRFSAETTAGLDEMADEDRLLEIEMRMEALDKENDELETELEKLDEQNTEILLKVAYYCFRRTDKTLYGLTEEKGVEILKNWMNASQLGDISEVAMGLNKLSPLRMGAAMRNLTLPR